MGQSAIILHAPSSGRERQRVLADLGPGTHRRLHGLTSGKPQLRILPELAAHVFYTPRPMARRLRLLTHGLKTARHAPRALFSSTSNRLYCTQLSYLSRIAPRAVRLYRQMEAILSHLIGL